jgi:hypothetical protein
MFRAEANRPEEARQRLAHALVIVEIEMTGVGSAIIKPVAAAGWKTETWRRDLDSV